MYVSQALREAERVTQIDPTTVYYLLPCSYHRLVQSRQYTSNLLQFNQEALYTDLPIQIMTSPTATTTCTTITTTTERLKMMEHMYTHQHSYELG